MQTQAAYVPVAVPAETSPKHPGRVQGIIGIVCAVIALGIVPPLFGIAGVILGVIALKKGERTLGLIAIVLSAVFMVIGMILGVVAEAALEQGGGFILGSVVSFF